MWAIQRICEHISFRSLISHPRFRPSLAAAVAVFLPSSLSLLTSNLWGRRICLFTNIALGPLAGRWAIHVSRACPVVQLIPLLYRPSRDLEPTSSYTLQVAFLENDTSLIRQSRWTTQLTFLPCPFRRNTWVSSSFLLGSLYTTHRSFCSYGIVSTSALIHAFESCWQNKLLFLQSGYKVLVKGLPFSIITYFCKRR